MKSNAQEIDASRMISSTIMATTIHAFIPLLWIFLVLYIIPSFVARFLELNLEIPALTAVFMKFYGIMSRYWYLYLFIMLSFLVTDGVVYFSLLRSLGKTPAGIWSIVVMLFEGILTVLCIIVPCLPLVKIITRIE